MVAGMGEWMRQRPVSRVLVFVWTVLLLLSACGGTPEPNAPEREEKLTARQALGDLRTLDACSLTDPDALKELGSVRDAGTVSLDYCLHHLRLDDGSRVQLATGELQQASNVDDGGAPVVRRGGLRIVRDSPLPGHCTRQVLFDDGLALQVNVDLLDGDPAAGLCRVAEAGAESVVRAIRDKQVGHRELPPHSLALADPCAALASEFVQQVPGLDKAKGRSTPSNHRCLWGTEAASQPRVRLTYTAGDPPKRLHATAVEEQIAGRRTVISIVGGDPGTPLCSAETAHGPFRDGRHGDAHSGQTEVAMLVVALPGSTGVRACGFARGLAERAWPQLPPR